MSTSTPEVCRACQGPNTVMSDENIPLCEAHWNRWLSRYFNTDELPPCGSHAIRDLTPDEKALNEKVDET